MSTATRTNDTTAAATGDLLAAALDAAGRGWPVFPLRPGAKQPALHGRAACPGTGACAGGHAGWEQRATTDPARIRAAWGSGTPYNVGIATGPARLCVIDLDAAKPGEPVPPRWAAEPGVGSGEDVLAVIAEEAGEELPGDTLTVATPSGGWHLYYAAPAGLRLRNTSGDTGRGLGWKIDTRAAGGYVVAPGSIVHGRAYRYVWDGPVAPLPGWLTDRLAADPPPAAPVVPIRTGTGRRASYLDSAIRAEAAKVRHATAGQRNACLYAAAVALGQLAAGGALTEHEVTAALADAAGRHIATGAYSARQAQQTIASGLRAGARRPRRIA